MHLFSLDRALLPHGFGLPLNYPQLYYPRLDFGDVTDLDYFGRVHINTATVDASHILEGSPVLSLFCGLSSIDHYRGLISKSMPA